jgi:hypothetical protein
MFKATKQAVQVSGFMFWPLFLFLGMLMIYILHDIQPSIALYTATLLAATPLGLVGLLIANAMYNVNVKIFLYALAYDLTYGLFQNKSDAEKLDYYKLRDAVIYFFDDINIDVNNKAEFSLKDVSFYNIKRFYKKVCKVHGEMNIYANKNFFGDKRKFEGSYSELGAVQALGLFLLAYSSKAKVCLEQATEDQLKTELINRGYSEI